METVQILYRFGYLSAEKDLLKPYIDLFGFSILLGITLKENC